MTKVLPFIEKSYSKMSIEIRFPLNENSYSPVDFIGEEDTVLSISTFSLFGCWNNQITLPLVKFSVGEKPGSNLIKDHWPKI